MRSACRFLCTAALVAISGCDAVRPTAVDPTIQPDAISALVRQTFVEEVVIDHVGPGDTHAGNGPHPTTESNRYSFLSGGIRWFNGATVEYRITGSEPFAGANAAIVAGEQVFDGLIAGRDFSRNDASTQLNPCTSQPNTISWASIDGQGSVIGSTRPCYNVATKELVGFTIILDSDDAWGTGGAATVFDVAGVAAHEFGHAVGLGHVSAPRDGCLTMYRYVIEEEVQKATPGLGDKLGLVVLYGNTDTSAGACGS
jgi:hypothetical protein